MANRQIGNEVATCTNATTKGSGFSPVMSHLDAAQDGLTTVLAPVTGGTQLVFLSWAPGLRFARQKKEPTVSRDQVHRPNWRIATSLSLAKATPPTIMPFIPYSAPEAARATGR